MVCLLDDAGAGLDAAEHHAFSDVFRDAVDCGAQQALCAVITASCEWVATIGAPGQRAASAATSRTTVMTVDRTVAAGRSGSGHKDKSCSGRSTLIAFVALF